MSKYKWTFPIDSHWQTDAGSTVSLKHTKTVVWPFKWPLQPSHALTSSSWSSELYWINLWALCSLPKPQVMSYLNMFIFSCVLAQSPLIMTGWSLIQRKHLRSDRVQYFFSPLSSGLMISLVESLMSPVGTWESPGRIWSSGFRGAKLSHSAICAPTLLLSAAPSSSSSLSVTFIRHCC